MTEGEIGIEERVSMTASLLDESQRDYDKAAKKFESSIRFLTYIQDTLDALPERDDDVSFYSHCVVYYDGPHVTVNYSTECEEDSDKLRSRVQRVMGIPAIRAIAAYSGNISWSFQKEFKDPENGDNRFGYIDISIDHGRLAPGCKIVERESTSKRFEVVCAEGMDPDAS
tara:strand:+ start:386 stop:895 length:510 start_codon:yes stop_codon:yes gene_type:complete